MRSEGDNLVRYLSLVAITLDSECSMFPHGNEPNDTSTLVDESAVSPIAEHEMAISCSDKMDRTSKPFPSNCESVDRYSAPHVSSMSRLPLELLLEILRYIDLADLFNLRRTDRWLYKMLRDVPPYPKMLSPWLSTFDPEKMQEKAELVRSVESLQFRVTDLPIKRNLEGFLMSGSIGSWRLNDRTYVIRDFAAGRERVLEFEQRTTAREFSSSRAVVATSDRMLHMFENPLTSEDPPSTFQVVSQIDELGIAKDTTILRDRVGDLWYVAGDAKPILLDDVDQRWDLVLLDMEGKFLYLLKNEGRRGISYESIDFATTKITKHASQTVGTIQGDEEKHGWINRHSKLWQPNQPVYYIHSKCLEGERLQIIRFNPKAPKGRNFVTGEYTYRPHHCAFFPIKPAISKWILISVQISSTTPASAASASGATSSSTTTSAAAPKIAA